MNRDLPYMTYFMTPEESDKSLIRYDDGYTNHRCCVCSFYCVIDDDNQYKRLIGTINGKIQHLYVCNRCSSPGTMRTRKGIFEYERSEIVNF